MFNPFGAFTSTAAGVPEGYNSYQDMRLKQMQREQAGTELEGAKAVGRTLREWANMGGQPSPPGAYPMPPMPGQASVPQQPGMIGPPQPMADPRLVRPDDPLLSSVWPAPQAPSPTSPVSQGWDVVAKAIQGGTFDPQSTNYVSPDRLAMIAQGGPQPPPQAPPGAPPMVPPEVSAQRAPQPMVPPQGGAPPPQPQTFGGLPPNSMNWTTIAQRVVQANPGAKPEVIAAAVTKFLPLMTAQSQIEWRQVLAAQREANIGIREAEHERRTRQGDERIAAEQKKREEIENRFQKRETRYAAKEAFQQDATLRRLELQEQALKERVEASKSRQDLALYNARRIELHQRAQEILNRYSINYSLPKDVKADLERELKERSDASDAEFKRLREQVQGGGKAEAPAAKPAATLPPEIVKQLKEGVISTLSNGQKWTLEGGQPKQVP